eukprot:scaffold1085_cov407-Prasinococcus_capsulatus_cf.AAC.78
MQPPDLMNLRIRQSCTTVIPQARPDSVQPDIACTSVQQTPRPGALRYLCTPSGRSRQSWLTVEAAVSSLPYRVVHVDGLGYLLAPVIRTTLPSMLRSLRGRRKRAAIAPISSHLLNATILYVQPFVRLQKFQRGESRWEHSAAYIPGAPFQVQQLSICPTSRVLAYRRTAVRPGDVRLSLSGWQLMPSFSTWTVGRSLVGYTPKKFP